jgi:PAS domain S-box-containing protein
MTGASERPPGESHATPHRHTRALAHLAEQALAELDLHDVIGEAVAILARTLEVAYSGFQELLPDGQMLVLYAGTGWKDGSVGGVTTEAAIGSLEGYTLAQHDAVRVDDLQSEPRFRPSPLLVEHAVVSSVTVAVRGPGRLYGVLGVYSTQRRVFGEEAVALLDGIAALIALASERQSWQQVASAGEERLRVAVEAGQMGTWEWDARAARLWWSPRVELMHGLSPGTFDGTIDAYINTLHPEDRALVLGTVPPTVGHELYTIEYRVIWPDGDVRWLEARGRLTRDENGQAVEMHGVCLDVTERKRADEAHRESEARFRSVTQSATDAIIAADSDGRITFWNNGARNLFGYQEDEVLGQPLTLLMPERYRGAHQRGLERVRSTGDQRTTGKTLEVEGLRKDGVEFPVELRLAAWAVGDRTFFSGIVRDVTERKQAEDVRRQQGQLRAAEERLKSVFAHATIGMAITDPHGRFLQVNPAYGRITGYTPEELYATDSPGITHSDDLPEHLRQTGLMLSDEIPSFVIEERYVRKDGSQIWVQNNVSCVRDAEGRPLHMITLTEDVTERHQVAEALEQRVQERTRELSAILEVTRAVGSSLELGQVLGLILDQLQKVVEHSSAVIYSCDEQVEFRVLEYRGPLPRQAMLGRRPAAVVADMIEESVNQRAPVLVEDWGDYTPLMGALQAEGVGVPAEAIGHGRSAQCVPLFVKGVVSGALYLLHPTPGYYTQEQAGLAMAFGQQVATAIENVRLYAQTRQHEHELATLLEISRTVSSTLELRPLLGVILDQLKTVVDYSGAGIYLGPDAGEYRLHEYRGPLQREDVVGHRVSPEAAMLIRDAMTRSGPVVVEDWGEQTPLMLAAAGAALPPGLESVGHGRALLWLPIIVRGAIAGALGVVHPRPGYYTERHGQLAMAFAQQVGSALENARLYEEAQGKAVLEERQRLARELHDSVSQVLYSIALNAASAAALRSRDPERAAALERDVHDLARVGLAEMRALIFELRPESLEQEGLVSALHKQAEAAQARHGFGVHINAVEEPTVPLAAKAALYRIAQEALQNVAKHADAQTVELTLEQTTAELVLRIEDDGRGFNPKRSFPGHLGLESMHERMAAVGGDLEIRSSRGRGTTVYARLSLIGRVGHPLQSV